MSCQPCKRRAKLMGRTFRRLIGSTRTSTSNVTVNKRECQLSRSITPEGYVAKCAKCGAVGEPSPIPETATLECKQGETNDEKS